MFLSPGRRFSVAIGRLAAGTGWLALAGVCWGADDPGARAVQQQLLQRQQQQDALQLRMQQQQRAVQSPPVDARLNQAREKLQIDQQQQQQQQGLHYRQGIEPPAAQPADDEGTRRAKAELERLKAQQQSQEQVRRSEWEMQQERPK